MERLPYSFVDFASALKLLADSQSDVTELVVKWNDIMDTTTAKSVEITLSDGTTKKVDNLAKIRNDLIAGLSLDEPTVKALHFNSYMANGGIDANSQYGLGWHANDYPFDSAEGFAGVYRSTYNELWTVAMTTISDISVDLPEIPRVVFLGVETDVNSDIIDNVTIHINPPNGAYVSNGMMAENRQYCTLVTFVNRNYGPSNNLNAYGYPVTLTLTSGSGTIVGNTQTIQLQANKSATFVLFAPAGGSVVNIHELKSNEA